MEHDTISALFCHGSLKNFVTCQGKRGAKIYFYFNLSVDNMQGFFIYLSIITFITAIAHTT